MSSPHFIIPGAFFTREGWDGIKAHVDRLAETPGGILIIGIEVVPRAQNWPDVSFTVFDRQERNAIRKAVTKVRAKRQQEAQSHEA